MTVLGIHHAVLIAKQFFVFINFVFIAVHCVGGLYMLPVLYARKHIQTLAVGNVVAKLVVA